MGNDIITIKLSRNDVGQIIDGLLERRDSWRNTQKYLGGKEVDCLIEECSDPEEANWIADYYDKIINSIKEQLSSTQ